MRELILHGVDADGTHLLLGDDSGAQYRLALDESLYAAVRRTGPWCAPMRPCAPATSRR